MRTNFLKFLSTLTVFYFLFGSTVAQIVRVEDNASQVDSVYFQKELDLNFYLVNNGNSVLRFGAGTNVAYHNKRSTILSINELRMIVSGSDNLENKGFQHLRYQHMLDSVITMELFSQVQFDQILKIEQRWLTGVGPRFHFLRKTNTEFYYGIHYMYEYEHEMETKIINSDHRMSTHLVLNREGKRNDVHAIAYYQPRLDNFNDFRVSGSLSIGFKILENLLFRAQAEIIYDSNPVEGVTDMVYTVNNGITLKF